MKRYILTGAPGAGKTVILHALQQRGYAVVEEAATDICAEELARGNAEPWGSPRFIDDIVGLQRQRREAARAIESGAQVFDRSPVCTLALARHLGFPVSEPLARELERTRTLRIYQAKVFFIESLGVIANTAIRRISLEEAQTFGEMHEVAYREQGYELIRIAPGPAQKRAEAVARLIQSWR
jgi:predicted ATPase